ncbi:MAG: LUD domain-containing protein [Anaerolineales bacterium]|nr:LUD domain-containing protein [Anaerolineales bacterium]
MNAREQIVADVQIALHRKSDSPVTPIPASARIAPRVAGDANAEMEMLFSEISKLGGVTGRIKKSGLKIALEKLVKEQKVKQATLWETPELENLGVAQTLTDLGVQLVSPHADKRVIAECDLGVTGVDCAFPETGTLMLRSSPVKPRAVSLLPRVHLAIVSPAALRADLGSAFAEAKGSNYWVFVTGPSRTADIELTVTIGVHGPKALYAWQVQSQEEP